MKKWFCILTALVIALSLSSVFAETANVFALQGPTGIGLCQVMEENDGSWNFELAGAPDVVVAAVVSGNADIACVPTNMAATLYNKTKGGIRLLALNTLGVLYILDNSGSVQNVQDLAGKTIFATGQGSTPEYVLNYILEANGLTDSVNVEYYAEHAELAALAASGKADLVLLPEPFVTSLMNQNASFHVALDVTECFENAARLKGEEATLSMGCVIARSDFVENKPETVERFLKEYERSVDFVNADPHAASLLVEKHGVMPKAAVAEKAIPNCHIVFVAGEEMKTKMISFFGLLFRANPASIGGAVPQEDLYY